jgi:hypothetical protein
VIHFLEQAHSLAVGRDYLHDSDLALNLLGVVVNERLPENSPAIRINTGGYFFISTILFILWLITLLVFD